MNQFYNNMLDQKESNPNKPFDALRSGAASYGINPTDRQQIPTDFLNKPEDLNNQAPFKNIAAEIAETYGLAKGGIISLRKRR